MGRVELVGAQICGGDGATDLVEKKNYRKSKSLCGWPGFVGIDRQDSENGRQLKPIRAFNQNFQLFHIEESVVNSFNTACICRNVH